MSDLREILRQAMRHDGHLAFVQFMYFALYCPNFGYYEQKDVSPGQKGDFFTSVSVGPFFGELIAAQIAEWWANDSKKTDAKSPWLILEAGAHNGQLARDILTGLKTDWPEVFESVEYGIVEPLRNRREMQAQMLAGFSGHVRWFPSFDYLPLFGFDGVILSNELLDAMPAVRLGWDAAKKNWFEWAVKPEGENFAWTKIPMSSFIPRPESALRVPEAALEKLLAVLPDGFTTEVCPPAVDWWREAAQRLNSGYLLTFDYGLLAEEFFTPERKDGTLRAYFRHQQSNDLLARPGEQDLTAQVNFTEIREAGEAEGLKTEIFSSQAQFLVGVMERHQAKLKLTPARVRQFQTLTHPEHLGRLFRVLVQGRKVE